MHADPQRPGPLYPFEPTRTRPPTPAATASFSLPHGRVLWLAAIPVIGAFVTFALMSMSLVPGYIAAWIGLPALFAGLAGMGLALVNIGRALARLGSASVPSALGAAGLALLTGLAATFSTFLSAAMVLGAGRGRQLRPRGRPVHAPLRDASPWVSGPATRADVALDDVAEAWRTNGQTEHASVAAFAELSIELVALGAPPRLIRDAHQDALDEMRHTEQCFDLARALDGRARGPVDFAAAARLSPLRLPRALHLARLAVTSLYDGALYEGQSARVVAGLARAVEDDRVRAVLDTIARDEARHAAHGFDVVRWCMAAGGPPVRAAVEVAIARLRRAAPHSLIADARAADGSWERWGIPSRARELEAWAVVQARVIARTERLLAEA